MVLKQVGHYTQLITSETSRVGCGAATYNNQIYAFCNYAFAQYNYERPYENGTSCSMCSKQNCKNKLCTCTKMCQNFGILDLKECKCDCLGYATGNECEILLCNKTDAQYGCINPNEPKMCVYANTNYNCPHLCGICSHRKQ